jgi:hypothetical protein
VLFSGELLFIPPQISTDMAVTASRQVANKNAVAVVGRSPLAVFDVK